MQLEATQHYAEPIGAAILDELRLGPVIPKELKQRVRGRFKGLTDKQCSLHLDALIAAEDIHASRRRSATGKVGKAIEAYVLGPPPPPPPPPRELAAKAILLELETRALGPADLIERIKQTLPALNKKDYSAAVEALLAARQIYARRKLTKEGKPGKAIEQLGLGAPPADEFVEPVLSKLKEMQRAAAGAGVDARAFTTALLAALARSGISGIEASSAATGSEREQVLQGLRQLVAREGKGALIPVRQLRALLRLEKTRFDVALLRLFADDAVILHHHDYVGSLSESERNELVLDQHGNYYIGVALRGEA
jgi:hypothetical protein